MLERIKMDHAPIASELAASLRELIADRPNDYNIDHVLSTIVLAFSELEQKLMEIRGVEMAELETRTLDEFSRVYDAIAEALR